MCLVGWAIGCLCAADFVLHQQVVRMGILFWLQKVVTDIVQKEGLAEDWIHYYCYVFVKCEYYNFKLIFIGFILVVLPHGVAPAFKCPEQW